MRKIIYFLSSLLILAIVASVFFFYVMPRMVKIPSLPDTKPEETIQVHSIVIEKVPGMSKMQLQKYQFQDIVKHKHRIDWWPDPEVTIQAFGEVIACVDFSKIDSSDILIVGDSLYLTLPEPEICVSKIDHNRSGVIESWATSLYNQGNKMIDQAYKIAEDKMYNTAMESGILDSTKIEAQKRIKKIVENLTQKTVFVKFPTQKQPGYPETHPLPKEIKKDNAKPGTVR